MDKITELTGEGRVIEGTFNHVFDELMKDYAQHLLGSNDNPVRPDAYKYCGPASLDGLYLQYLGVATGETYPPYFLGEWYVGKLMMLWAGSSGCRRGLVFEGNCPDGPNDDKYLFRAISPYKLKTNN